MMNFPTGRMDLYLTDIGEPRDNQLRLVVAEAVLGEITSIDDADFRIENVRPMIVTDSSRVFELEWADYVAYVVRNESFWKSESNEPPFENHLVRRFDSAFLKYVSDTTFADDDYPGPLRHWALSTLNHCVDVVSACAPSVRLIEAGGAGRLPTSPNFQKV